MSTPHAVVELSDREFMYLRNASFLPPELGALLDAAGPTGNRKHVLSMSRDTAEMFREQFTNRLAKVGFGSGYEPTSEGEMLETLIDRFYLA